MQAEVLKILIFLEPWTRPQFQFRLSPELWTEPSSGSAKFSSNFGSEPNHSITTFNVLSLKSYKISRLISVSNHPLYGSSRTNRGMNTCALSLKTPITCYHSTKGSCTSSQTTERVIVDLVGCHYCTGVFCFVSLLGQWEDQHAT